jgi:dTDP-4-amino-4,6-dideoxygalactose transaminase
MSTQTRAGRAAPEEPRDDKSTTDRWTVPLSDVLVDDEIEQAVADVVRSGWWSMGPRVAEFERAFADLCRAKHALAVANGTAALHLALLALELGPGDEVLVPSLNFVAAANTIAHTGATPVFCDVVGPADLTVDPADLEAAITPKTRAILVMHYGGHACRMDEIAELAAQHGLPVIEDAAHAPGGQFRGRACGTIGAVGCFSFFSNKNLPVGEGGMVVTQDDALAEKMRLFRSHGMTTLTWDRHRGHAASYDVVLQGFNYRLDELRAAIGLAELGRLTEGNAARGRIVGLYRAALDGVAGISMPFAPRPDVLATYHLAVVVLPEHKPRAEVQAALAERRIQTSVHYPPIHMFSAYRAEAQRSLPVTEAVADRLVTLPLFPHMTDAQVSTVIEAVLAAV